MSGNYLRKDHFYKQAKDEGYRSRAAYKLLELDKKFKLFKNTVSAVDLGCFPGGWLQVAANLMGKNASLVGIDLTDVQAFRKDELRANAAVPTIIKGDFLSRTTQELLLSKAALPIQLVLSDMSPKLSGVRDRDIMRSMELVENAFLFANKVLGANGVLVAKIFPSPEADELFNRFKTEYKRIHRVHLKSSRKSSNEIYLLACGFSPSP